MPLAAGIPTVATAAPADEGNELLLELWHQRAKVLAEIEALDAAHGQANARMPWWAQPGPMYIDAKGKHVGELTEWPAREDVGLPSVPSAYRILRPSPRTLKRDYKTSVSTWGPKAIREARARHRNGLRALALRLRRRKAEQERVGLPAIEADQDAAGERLCALDRHIERLPPTIATMAAVILIHNEVGFFGAALQHARPALPGVLQAEVDRRFVSLAV